MNNTLKIACFGNILYEYNNIKSCISKNLFNNNNRRWKL